MRRPKRSASPVRGRPPREASRITARPRPRVVAERPACADRVPVLARVRRCGHAAEGGHLAELTEPRGERGEDHAEYHLLATRRRGVRSPGWSQAAASAPRRTWTGSGPRRRASPKGTYGGREYEGHGGGAGQVPGPRSEDRQQCPLAGASTQEHVVAPGKASADDDHAVQATLMAGTRPTAPGFGQFRRPTTRNSAATTMPACPTTYSKRPGGGSRRRGPESGGPAGCPPSPRTRSARRGRARATSRRRRPPGRPRCRGRGERGGHRPRPLADLGDGVGEGIGGQAEADDPDDRSVQVRGGGGRRRTADADRRRRGRPRSSGGRHTRDRLHRHGPTVLTAFRSPAPGSPGSGLVGGRRRSEVAARGWSAGTSTRWMRTPLGSSTQASARPHGSRAGGRVSRTSREAVRPPSGPSRRPGAERAPGRRRVPAPDTSMNPPPAKKTTPRWSPPPNSRETASPRSSR